MACFGHRDQQLNPVVTSGIYQAGAELLCGRPATVPAGVTNAIFAGQQVLLIWWKAPGALATADNSITCEAAHENEPRLAVPSCHGGDDRLNTQLK